MKRITNSVIFTLLCLVGISQDFSEDPVEFGQQAEFILKSVGNEAYNKVAYDFVNVWNTKLTSDHQTKVMEIAKTMQKKGYSIHPHYKHLFAYITNGVTLEGIQAQQLDELLEINQKVVHSLGKTQYANFLFEMNTFLGARILHMGKNLMVTGQGGSYTFELLGDVAIDDTPDYFQQVQEEISDEEMLAQQAAELEATAANFDAFATDPNAEADSWDNSGWGTTTDESTDDWGNSGWDDTSTEDDWGTSDWGDSNDDWGSSGDDWGSADDSGSDDGWGNSNDSWGGVDQETLNEANAAKPPTPVRDKIGPSGIDYVAVVKSRYNHPTNAGPVMHLKASSIGLITPWDSLVIKSVDGDQLFQSRVFSGSKGVVEWPAENLKMKGANVELEAFHVKVDRGDFRTPNATLSFPGLFSGTPEGEFYYRSDRRARNAPSNYPQFRSYKAEIKMDISEKASYEGGIEVRGNEVWGKAISKEIGKLTILDGLGRTVVFRSSEFKLGDSLVTSPDAAVTIIHGFDSIYHPSVTMEYYVAKNQVKALRTKDFSTAPFHSTFFDMNYNVDYMSWNLGADSINFSILNGGDMVPATFESTNYFSPERYARLSGPWGFHPIGVTVNYAHKYGIKEYNYLELVNEYKVNELFILGAIKMLEMYHFADFNENTGMLKLNEKAFHYYNSSAKRTDFDNLFMASKVLGQPNATVRLDSGQFVVRGVKKFYVTADYKVAISPDEGDVVLEKGRNVTFNGEVEAGDFDYKGHNFTFDYDQFILDLKNVDSISLQVPVPDSVSGGHNEKKSLSNHLTETSGVLYLNDPDNRSGRRERENYPYFVSESEAIVYFDGKEVLNGAYDKSVKFIIPPMQIDDIDADDITTILFPGTFNSGKIFPDFYDTLHVMEDQSLGFVHQIPEQGYNLYGTPAKTYESIFLSNDGIRGGGKIDFLKTSVFSEDFIYYPDSVTANGYVGEIRPGNVGTASFPQAELGSFRMYWLPRVDSMYLRTIGDPFKFYNSTAELTGAANVTQNGVYGYGSMLTRGSIAESNEMQFQEFKYSAYHANFQVLSDDPEKPAMAGDDIRLEFDLNRNIADIHPEQTGVAAISFPYAQIKTSITNAEWLLSDSIITMTKPDEVAIEDSYFYTTREDLDSLSFNATRAVYDIKSYELNIQGIPFIEVADALITPENNHITVHANSDLEILHNAELLFEYPNATHTLTNGVIDVISRNEFTGKATYLLPVAEDTFEIEMNNFYMEDRYDENDNILSSTKGEGEILADEPINIAQGFVYKGGVTMHAYKQALELDGFVKPSFNSMPDHNYWVTFSRKDDNTAVEVDFTNAKYDDGDPALAGIHFGSLGKLYTTFVEKRIRPVDDDFFVAKGTLKYNELSGNYSIEENGKATGESYAGHSMIYSDSTQDIIFEGTASFMNKELNLIGVESSVLGFGNRKDNNYSLDGFFMFDLNLPQAAMQLMTADVLDIIERLGNAPANDLSIENMLKLSNIIGEEATRLYETNSLKDYVPLVTSDPNLNKSIVVSGVKMEWNDEENAWYNTTKLGLSNILIDDINAKVDGFLEFKKDDTGGDVMNLFIQAAPGSWYYFNYQENSLLTFSSNKAFNAIIEEKSNFGNSRPGELVLIAGEENETLKFLNEFRKTYFGIDEAYNLVYPDEATLDDQSFETIEEESDDDGFGF
ncbi:MAG: hypothetical protein JXQ90_13255 [Cyclobacteriaceae bacterium]